MSLFNIVPSTFFSVLSSPNKELYIESLLKLNEMFRYGLNIELEDYLSNLIAILETRDYIAEDGDDENVSNIPLNKKARLILNRFISTGWIDKEYKEGSFREVLVLHDYSIKTLKLLEQLSDSSVKEYNSLVFSSYSSLKQAYSEDSERMYDALITAKNNSNKLIDELKSLFHNIRDYHNSVSLTDNVNELLKNQFDTYQALIDKIYHPIKTMDSVHRYSGLIKDILREVSIDDVLLETMAQRAMIVNLYQDVDTAMLHIHNDINEITNAFNSIPTIVDDIDRKHTAYSRISIEKMQYLLSGDRTIKGKLITILNSYAQNENKQDNFINILQSKINVDRQEYIDKKSLYHKNIRSRRIITEPLKISKPDTKKNDEQFKEILNKMKDSYSDSRLNSYMMNILKDKDKIDTSDISVENDSDFIILILAAIKANNNKMKYTINYKTGNIINNGYTIPNAIIYRKERKV